MPFIVVYLCSFLSRRYYIKMLLKGAFGLLAERRRRLLGGFNARQNEALHAFHAAKNDTYMPRQNNETNHRQLSFFYFGTIFVDVRKEFCLGRAKKSGDGLYATELCSLWEFLLAHAPIMLDGIE